MCIRDRILFSDRGPPASLANDHLTQLVGDMGVKSPRALAALFEAEAIRAIDESSNPKADADTLRLAAWRVTLESYGALRFRCAYLRTGKHETHSLSRLLVWHPRSPSR